MISQVTRVTDAQYLTISKWQLWERSEWGNLELPLDGCKVSARRTETLKENPFNDNKMPRRDVKEFLLRVAGICDTDNGSQTEIVRLTIRSIVKFKLWSSGWLAPSPWVWWMENKQTKLKQKRAKTSRDISHLSGVLMEGKLRHYSH